jgi:hypothetical protein
VVKTARWCILARFEENLKTDNKIFICRKQNPIFATLQPQFYETMIATED